MRPGLVIFGDIQGKLDVLNVECTNCARKGVDPNLITAPIGTPHTVFDVALKRTDALFLKAKAGTKIGRAHV